MRSIVFAASAAALLGWIPSPSIAEVESRTFGVDEAVTEALEANPELAAARLAIDIAKSARMQAGRLGNPEIELDFADDFTFAGEGESQASVAIAQSFPITARLQREKEVASRDVEIAEAEVRDFMRALVAEVETTFFEVRALDERIATNLELIGSMRNVERITAKRLEAAETSQADLSLLRVERARIEQEIQRLEQDRAIARSALTRLLGRSAADGLELTGELEPEVLPAVEPMAAESRPDLVAARSRIDRADADRSLARAEIWQDWSAGIAYERDVGTLEGNGLEFVDRDQLIGFRIRVPLPIWNRNEGRIAAAEAEWRRSRLSSEALALRADEQVRAAASRVRSLRTSADAYADEIVPEAARARELFDRGYSRGLVGISELLQAQRQYNEIRSLQVEVLGQLRMAVIELESVTGTSPHLATIHGQGATP